MIYKNEKDFQTALIKTFQKEGMYVRNIPDIGNVKKPFDISANFMGRGAAFELKYVKTQKEPTGDAVYKMLYPHQVANLIQFSGGKSLGVSLVFAYHPDTQKTFCYEIQELNGEVKLQELFHGDLTSLDFFAKILLIFNKK